MPPKAASVTPPVDSDALAAILARAASPWERARSSWLEPAGSARVEERLESWAYSVADGQVDELRRLLARRGLRDDALTRALSDAQLVNASLEPPTPPRWAQALAHLVGAARRQDADPPRLRVQDLFEPAALPDTLSPDAAWRFGTACEPWLAVAADALTRSAGRCGAELEPDAMTDLLGGLAARWHEILVRVLLGPPTLGDYVRSPPVRDAPSVEAAYLGTAPGIEEWLRLWAAYPGAGRLMALCFEFWRTNVNRLFTRLVRDEATLASVFGKGRPLGRLAHVRFAGDPHEGHQQVMLLSFSLGVGVAYKPRPLSSAQWYARAARELLGLADEPCGKLVARRGYGWQGIVTQTACEDRMQLERYFRRIGAHARLLELVDAVDMHGENVIACGEQPVLIDVETLLTPRFPDPDVPASIAQATAATPLRTGLISMRARGRPGRAALELGALARPGWAQTPWDVPITDALPAPLTHDAGRFQIVSALPLHNGRRVLPDDFEEQIVAGFVEADRQLAGRAESWLKSGGLSAVARLRTRFVHRETRVYAQVATASLSPAALRDGIAREVVLGVLWRAERTGTLRVPALLPAEESALRDLDIPFVLGEPDTRDLIARGQRLRGCLSSAPSAALLQRAAAQRGPATHSPAARIRVALFVRDPLLSRTVQADPAVQTPAPEVLGAQLLALATNTQSGPVWTGLRYEAAHDCWSVGPLLSDLMSGYGGLAAVLADLANATASNALRTSAAALVLTGPEQLSAETQRAGPAVCTVAGAAYGFHRANTTLGLDTTELERTIVVLAREAEHTQASSWLLALSGCCIASPALRRVTLLLAARVREQIEALDPEQASYAQSRLTQMSQLEQALVALTRMAAATGERRLLPPAELRAAVCEQDHALDSLAAHALLDAGGLAPAEHSMLHQAIRRHRPDVATAPLERAEHHLTRQTLVGGDHASEAAEALAQWSADESEPACFHLAALGGLAGACHLALRLRRPDTVSSLRTLAPGAR